MLGTSTAWPSEETGNSSLAPCRRPMNNAWARVRAATLQSPDYIRGAMARLAVFNAAVKTLEESIARAKAAERLGFESVWTTQMPDARDASLVLAAYSHHTERVGLGTGVLPIYTRHPTAMAQMAATLDELSGGRFILGIGISHKVTVEGMWGLSLDDPVGAMREYLTIVRGVLVDGNAGFEGRHFTARAVYSAPHRADLPIMISALNPRMLELAGELADGVVLYMCTPAYVRDHVVPTLRRGREKAGKPLEGFDVVAAVPVCLTSNRAAAHDVFRKTVARYANLPYYRKMMDASGLKSELDAEQVDERVLDELAGIGDEKQVRDAVQRYREAGVTLPGVGPFGGHEGARGFEATLEAVAGA
jgi:F420-dependent oxidoreductase-like protein